MRYRVTTPSQPFRLLPNIQEQGKTRLVANLKVRRFHHQNVRVPCACGNTFLSCCPVNLSRSQRTSPPSCAQPTW
jgi:hypothetical protein